MKAILAMLTGFLGLIGSPEVLGLMPEYIALILQGVGLIVAGLSASPLMKKSETDGVPRQS